MADVKDATKAYRHSVEFSAAFCGAQFWTMLDFTALRLQSPCIVDVVDIQDC